MDVKICLMLYLFFFNFKVMINRTLPEPCSLEVDLYRALPEHEHIIPERTSSSQCDT